MLKQRNKVLWAVAGSIGLHILLLLSCALMVQWLPRSNTASSKPPQPLKVTLEEETPTPPPVVIPTDTPPPVHFLDAGNMAEVSTPPPDAKYRSAKNTVDASELSATSDKPLPTQLGRQSPVFALNTQAFLAGDAASQASPARATPPPETAPPLPRAVATQNRSATAVTSTPPVAPKPEDFALATPASLPTEPKGEENPYDPSIRSSAAITEPPLPTPVHFASGRTPYQSQQTKTAMSGSINNRGAASLASASSPMGRYQSAVIDAIGRRWNSYVESRSDVVSLGTVKIHFLVGMDGKARGTQVIANTANEALASISLKAIADASIPPMPSDAIPDTGGGQLPMDLTFNLE